mmetsp:Transcript_41303/g.86485  ORF Transcript_41303/g.86485 Transcript_41303/m.86485 type:complete len:396 (-) Transcript_41303:583-1770(-)
MTTKRRPTCTRRPSARCRLLRVMPGLNHEGHRMPVLEVSRSSTVHKTWRSGSDGHLHLDLAVWVVACDLEVGEGAVLDVLHLVRDVELREELRFAQQLLLKRVDVVVVDVRVADDVDEVAALEPRHVREQAREQRVRGDVERNAKAEVGRALVHLAGELAIRHIELREHVARRQRHLRDVLRVPRGEDDATVVRLVLDRIDHLLDLVDALPRVVVVHRFVLGAEMPPLPAVDWAQVADLPVRESDRVEVVARRVAVPDLDLLVLQRLGARVARNEPQQLLRHAAPKDRLGGEEREVLPQREAHLHAKARASPDAGAVRPRVAVANHVAHQVEVLHLLMLGCRSLDVGRLVRDEAVAECVLRPLRGRLLDFPDIAIDLREEGVAAEVRVLLGQRRR